jgi:HSP20 family protein
MRGREFAESVGSEVLKRAGRAASRFQEESPLPVDMLEGDDEYLLVFDAPGADASDVQVSYEGDSEVRVRVDRFRGFREGFEMVFPGRGLTLEGSAKLPEDAVVDAESARAELNDDGTLYVFLPKRGDDATTIDVTVTDDDESDADDDDTDGAAEEGTEASGGDGGTDEA